MGPGEGDIRSSVAEWERPPGPGTGRSLGMEGGPPQPGCQGCLWDGGCLRIPPLIIFLLIFFIFYFWTDS